jgi:hypothetical protein
VILFFASVQVETKGLEQLIWQNNLKDKEVSLIFSCSFQVRSTICFLKNYYYYYYFKKLFLILIYQNNFKT